MRAGKLRRRASLQRKEVTQDSFGSEIASWVEFGMVWASVEPLTGREFLAALGQGDQGEVTTRIRLRFRADVRTADRVVVGGRVFDIRSALPDERERELVLMGRELVG